MLHNTIIDNATIQLYAHDMTLFDNDVNIVPKVYEEVRKITDDIPREAVSQRLDTLKRYRGIFLNLKKLPFVKQRTIEWLDLRKDRLTASDLYDAIKGGNTTLSLAKKKANLVKDKTNYNHVPALKWGTMFEAMATRCYSQANNNIYVHDFGLICDKTNQHFGASPDGITDLGVMIEIKCPYSRKIVDGFIPPKYKMQIQGQLAVCELSECDYIECDFKTFESMVDYLAQDTSTLNHGIIAEYINNGEYSYLYSDPNLTPQDSLANIQKQIDANKSHHVNKLIPWKLNEMNVQRVAFNATDWQNTVPKINEFWNQVEEYKLCPPPEQEVKKIQFIDDNE